MSHSTEAAALVANMLEPDEIVLDEAERSALSSDVYARGATAALLLRPACRERLATAIGALTRGGFAIIPRGGGMSYTGGVTPSTERSVVVDLSRLNRIVAVSAEDLLVTVECGVTWKQLHEHLHPLGLRLPFFGTFSGAQATVGGGLSNGALFFGTARYGTAADNVLSIEVVLADGSRLRTGQGGFRNVAQPFIRGYGPDLTGLFCHDCGALGVKVEATFRLIRTPPHAGYASFAFTGIQQAARALSEVARSGAAEELYVFDPQSTRRNLESGNLAKDLRTLTQVMRAEKRLLAGLRQGARLVAAGRDFIGPDDFSLHVVCAARNTAALEADLQAVRNICANLDGRAIPDSIPRTVRATLFPALDAVLGPDGDRWAALNAKVTHSNAARLIEAAGSAMQEFDADFRQHKIWMSHLLIAVGQQAFSFEPVFHWFDEWLPMHERMPSRETLQRLQRPPAAPLARAVVGRARARMLEVFQQHGAASNQIGKTYPYLSAMQPSTRVFVEQLKLALDPDAMMNPGVLGLGRSGPS